jgi:hypothetical protein
MGGISELDCLTDDLQNHIGRIPCNSCLGGVSFKMQDFPIIATYSVVFTYTSSVNFDFGADFASGYIYDP